MMKRREFITLLAGTAAWPLAARAQQQPAMPVIGLLSSRSPAVDTPLIVLIRQGLGESGLVEGQNIAFDYCCAAFATLAKMAATSPI
jgi:putative ABC transport system substrate-binding protein